jgi:hypothetical protein
MFSFGKSTERNFAKGMITDPKWAKSAKGRFHRFLQLDPEGEGLTRVSGVYVIWHAGVRPEWIYVGRSADLAAAFHHHGHNRTITKYEINGGLYVTWALIREEYQDGAVKYLTDSLKPRIENPEFRPADVIPVPVTIPGTS